MVRGRTETGEMEVRVVLQVRIDRDRWVTEHMYSNPAETLDRDIRRSVKQFARTAVDTTTVEYGRPPITYVIAEGIYE